ncbi:hypothetical protein J3E68DRAFT_420596, partial [Trichoderma sp. SZMC 28012]
MTPKSSQQSIYYPCLQMSDITIFLTETQEGGGTYRAKNLREENFRKTLQSYGDQGKSFIARAEILSVCSGKLKSGGDGTLLIFRFTFIPLNRNQRFTSAQISVEFRDTLQRENHDPEVLTISPMDTHYFDTIKSEIKKEKVVGANVNTSGGAMNLEVGGGWKLTTVMSKEWSVRLGGAKIISRSSFMEPDDTAMWVLDEHNSKKQGVPDVFRTAVLLGRKSDDKFQLNINIETKVDTMSTAKNAIKRLFGKTNPEPVDPVNIDSQLFLMKDVDIPELAKVRTGEMALDDLDLSKYVGLYTMEKKYAESM